MMDFWFRISVVKYFGNNKDKINFWSWEMEMIWGRFILNSVFCNIFLSLDK